MAIPRIVLIARASTSLTWFVLRLRRGRSPATEPTLPARIRSVFDDHPNKNSTDTVRPYVVSSADRTEFAGAEHAGNRPSTYRLRNPGCVMVRFVEEPLAAAVTGENQRRISIDRGEEQFEILGRRGGIAEPGTARWFQRRPGRRFRRPPPSRSPCRGSLESGNRLDRTR